MCLQSFVLLSGTSYAMYNQTYGPSEVIRCRFVQKQ